MSEIEYGSRYGGGLIDAGGLLGKNIGLIFTDRDGGHSHKPYDTLNLAYHTGDNPRNVLENRKVVAAELNIDLERFVFPNQVHGIKVQRALHMDMGNQDVPASQAFPETDGVFTTEAMLVLSVLTADCLPLAMAEPQSGVVAMLHAGWRGTLMDIVGAALRRFQDELRIYTEEFRVVIGPGIGPCCYRVDEGRARAYVEKYGRYSGVISEKNDYFIDLFQANRINMLQAGIREDNIKVVGGCTCCGGRHFSFRRDGVTGRQGSFVYRKS